ncbi:MAG TPA: hypothetical protein ENH82_14310, partial [bacterium]|nr:hypothetical protein [bacterium]
MMREKTQNDIRNTPLFKKLLADASAIEKDFYVFKQKYHELWNIDHELKATVLQCHLILEVFLAEYLKHANPAASRIGKSRLTFAQKVELAYHPQTNFAFLIEGIKSLNTLRNKLAHHVGYRMTEEDIAPMKQSLQIWHDAAGKTMPEGLQVIETFTELTCGFLDGTVQSIKWHGADAGLSGLFQWYGEDETAEQT